MSSPYNYWCCDYYKSVWCHVNFSFCVYFKPACQNKTKIFYFYIRDSYNVGHIVKTIRRMSINLNILYLGCIHRKRYKTSSTGRTYTNLCQNLQFKKDHDFLSAVYLVASVEQGDGD